MVHSLNRSASTEGSCGDAPESWLGIHIAGVIFLQYVKNWAAW